MSTQYLLRRHLSTCHSSYCTETGLCSNYDLDIILHRFKSLRLNLSWDLFYQACFIIINSFEYRGCFLKTGFKFTDFSCHVT